MTIDYFTQISYCFKSACPPAEFLCLCNEVSKDSKLGLPQEGGYSRSSSLLCTDVYVKSILRRTLGSEILKVQEADFEK